MRYHTVQEISRLAMGRIHSVRQVGRYVEIQLSGNLIERDCGNCKKGSHTGAGVAPRILIRSF